MNLSPLLDLVRSSAAYQELLLALQSAHTPPSVVSLNLLSAARPFLLAALHQDYPQPILLVAPKPEQALVLSRQLVHYNPPTADVLLFPEAECLPYERASMSPGTRQKRIAALHRLTLARQSPRPLILIASVRSLMQQTLAPAHYEQSVHTIQRDGRYPLDALMRQWQQSGYEPVDTVEQPGQFAHRGGILDIWSPAHDMPVRLEFFGDEVDSIRRFDIASQRSREPLDEVTFLPASETLPAFGGLAARRLRALVDNAAHLTDSAQRDFNDDLRALGEGKRFKDLEFYLPYLEQEPACLLDYLGDGALVVSDDWQEVQAQAQSWELEVAQLQQDAVSRGEVPPSFSAPVTSWDGIRFDRLKRLDFTFGLVEDSLGRWEELFHTPPQYSGRMLQAVEDWKSRSENQTQPSARLVVVSRQAERIAELMREQDVQVAVQETVHEGRLSLLQGTLAAGFVFEPTSLLVLSDTEIFGYARPEPRRSSEKRAAPSESYYADLMPGDYVVHVEHGIARYTGLVRRDFYYGEREYLQLEFAESDRLYVPTYQADRVARYVNSGAHPPAIHRLGSADWETAKSQAKRAIDDLADELMELYAKREQVSGHAFAADSTWQRELEDSFPFAETPDQLRALAAIKQDMESPKPMDRLICGDVGYGKTEVG
ncbi:MAG: hypothetical protein HYR71_07205, partial [Chloroflexi bacterium]|nr:hypothetical protein [Chloroflexota bacterium]